MGETLHEILEQRVTPSQITEINNSLNKFIDELSLSSWEYYDTIDKNSDARVGIKFKFIKASNVNQHIRNDYEKTDDFKKSKPNITERKGLVTSRVGQGTYRISILDKWNNQCAVTKCKIKSILIASHIVPWSVSNNEERLDVDNGILLSPNYEANYSTHLDVTST